MLLLAANRRLGTNRQSATSLNWTCRDALAAHELDGKNLLIIGYGRIGKQLAAMAAPFGLRVLVYDPYLAADDLGEVERVADLNQALPRADLVSLHAPQSQGALIGANELALLPRDAVLVNTARGGLIDEQALAAALASGQIGAAGLDVLGQEPPPPRIIPCSTHAQRHHHSTPRRGSPPNAPRAWRAAQCKTSSTISGEN